MSDLSRRALLVAAAAALVPLPAHTQAARSVVIRGGTVRRPGAPDAVSDVVIAGETIRSVGGGGVGDDVLDATGKVVTAGFIDPLTRTGLVEIDLEPSSDDSRHEIDDSVRAAFRAADGFNPAATHIPVTRTGGITSVGVVPTGGLVPGQSAWVDLVSDPGAQALGAEPLALHVSLDDWGPRTSRGTALLRLRELFDDAQAFARNPGAFERRQHKGEEASRLDLEAVARTLGGKLPVVFHADRASDLVAVLELSTKLRLRPVLASAAEAWKVAARLARAKVPVIVNPLVNGPESFAARYARDDNAALLHAAGVPVCLTTGETHNARKLRQVAGNAVRAGLPRDAALAAVTRAPAEAFGLGARYGSVEPGHVANVVVWSGDPFEPSTKVEAVFVRGARTSLRTRQTALFERYR